MLLKYFYDDALAHASYLVGCQRTGEAIVVDPGRDIDQYLEMARRENLRIAAVAETHIHADYVSGARELADRIGAKLFVSDAGRPNGNTSTSSSTNRARQGWRHVSYRQHQIRCHAHTGSYAREHFLRPDR